MEATKANPENLVSILQAAYQAKVVVPEFQRSFVWARDSIEELLVSILQGYFVGTLLLSDTPTSDPLFPYRKIEGLEKVNPAAHPENHQTIRLLLDGQQRVTSLFYVLYEPEMRLRNSSHAHKFFFKIDNALDGDPEDAVVGLPVSSKRRMAEMKQLLAEHRAIPFSMLRDESRFYKWLYTEQTYLTGEAERKLIEGFCRNFVNFLVPVVALPSTTKKNDIVNIFERINRTGISLSTFDLAAARLFKKQVPLRELWKKFEKAYPKAAAIIKPEFTLKFISLVHGKAPRKSELVDVADTLTHDEFIQNWDLATKYIVRAFERITSASSGYGAFTPKWIPYSTMIVPLAVMLMKLDVAKSGQSAYSKLDIWYWTSIFSERFDSAVDTKSYDDISDVQKWIESGETPNWIKNFKAENVDLTAADQRSAVYRGVMSLVALRGAQDFCKGIGITLEQCDDDHIFPHSKYKKYETVNTIVNRTLISEESNREIKRAKRPPEYLPIFLEKHGGSENSLRKTLDTHFINAEALVAMRDEREGAFENFIEARRKAIVQEIKERTSSQ